MMLLLTLMTITSALMSRDEAAGVLGVSTTSPRSEIRGAWRKLILIHSPDKGGDVEVFHRVQEAYETLTADDASSSSTETPPSSPRSSTPSSGDEIVPLGFPQLMDEEGVAINDIDRPLAIKDTDRPLAIKDIDRPLAIKDIDNNAGTTNKTTNKTNNGSNNGGNTGSNECDFVPTRYSNRSSSTGQGSATATPKPKGNGRTTGWYVTRIVIPVVAGLAVIGVAVYFATAATVATTTTAATGATAAPLTSVVVA